MPDALKSADVWTVLDLIVAAFTTDAESIAGFDLRLVSRAIELSDAHHARPEPSIAELQTALDESVQLQSHYAHLLNLHDGGSRVGFANGAAWIRRLRDAGTLPKVSR
jgi:hypothetical protein